MILTQVDQGSTTVNINAVLQQTEINISLFVFNRYICQRPGGFCKVSIFFFFCPSTILTTLPKILCYSNCSYSNMSTWLPIPNFISGMLKEAQCL